MEFHFINFDDDLSYVVKILNESHATVAAEFGFTRETNPSNNAFIDEQTLRIQLENGIALYQLNIDGKSAGCIAIEKSMKEKDSFYIEKVSMLPEYRHKGYGSKLLEFAEEKIIDRGGSIISVSLIDSNFRLKQWYIKHGFIETSVKDFPHLPFRVCFMSKQLNNSGQTHR